MARASSLFSFAARSHVLGALSCGIGGGVAMWVIAIGYVREMETFEGGAAAFGAYTAAAAEAMRVMRWPADRLDTLGGYLTYHNVTLLPLLLGLYAAIQGAQALRGVEEKRILDVWLATGRSRWSIVRDRSAAFIVALAILTLGVGLGLIGATAMGGEMQVGPALVVATEASLAAAVFYALAMLLSSVFATSGAAAGVTVLIMIGLYLMTNIWDRLGPLGALRFVSPFFYRQRSELLIPGREVDLPATAALLLMFVALVMLAAYAFVRRDYAGALWRRKERGVDRARATRLAWRPTVWLASLAEQRVGLVAWAAGAGVFMGAYATLIPQVQDIWDRLGFLKVILIAGEGDVVSQLVAFSVEALGPFVGAFAVVQSARWARERSEGIDELLLAQPITRSRYVFERLIALAVATVVVVAGAAAGLAIGGLAVGVSLDAAALARTAADLVLLALAVGGVGAIAVAVLGGTTAVAALTAWIVVAYLIVLFAPLFDWPAWLLRLSPFDAFGHPYLGTPDTYGLAYLAALAIAGAALSVAVLERRRAV